MLGWAQVFHFKSLGVSQTTFKRARADETWSGFDRWNMPAYPRPEEWKTSRQESWNLWEIHAEQHMCRHVRTYHTFWQMSARGMPKIWLLSLAFRHLFWRLPWSQPALKIVWIKKETSRNDGERPDLWSLCWMEIKTNDKTVHRCEF